MASARKGLEMDISKLTRMQAERLVARTSNEATLVALTKHKNKHVVAKANAKIARLPNVIPPSELPGT